MNVAAPVKPSLTLKRRIKASPAKVFAAWTDPKLMARWLGPVGTVELTAKTDVRVGGRYEMKMRMPDDEHNVSGVYREIIPNEKLVFTWAWRTMPERESVVTILIILRLQGLLELPIAIFIIALVVVAEATLSAER